MAHYRGYVGSYWDNGKENGNYYNGLNREYGVYYSNVQALLGSIQMYLTHGTGTGLLG